MSLISNSMITFNLCLNKGINDEINIPVSHRRALADLIFLLIRSQECQMTNVPKMTPVWRHLQENAKFLLCLWNLGETLPLSSGNKITLKFSANGTGTAKGFHFVYQGKHFFIYSAQIHCTGQEMMDSNSLPWHRHGWLMTCEEINKGFMISLPPSSHHLSSSVVFQPHTPTTPLCLHLLSSLVPFHFLTKLSPGQAPFNAAQSQSHASGSG